MYCLADDIAQSRFIYSRPLATLPDLLLIDIPVRYVSPSLALGRYYPVIIETAAELDEFESWIREPRAAPVPPDLLDKRASHLRADGITLANYDPPTGDYPFALLCHWPAQFTGRTHDPAMFARGAYTTEFFLSSTARAEAAHQLLETMAGDVAISVSIVAPQPKIIGTA